MIEFRLFIFFSLSRLLGVSRYLFFLFLFSLCFYFWVRVCACAVYPLPPICISPLHRELVVFPWFQFSPSCNAFCSSSFCCQLPSPHAKCKHNSLFLCVPPMNHSNYVFLYISRWAGPQLFFKGVNKAPSFCLKVIHSSTHWWRTIFSSDIGY